MSFQTLLTPTDGFDLRQILPESEFPTLRQPREAMSLNFPYPTSQKLLQQLFGATMSATVLTLDRLHDASALYGNVARAIADLLRLDPEFRTILADEAGKFITIARPEGRLLAAFRGYVVRLSEEVLAMVYFRGKAQRLFHAMHYRPRLNEVMEQARADAVAALWPDERVVLDAAALKAAVERLPYRFADDVIPVTRYLGAPTL